MTIKQNGGIFGRNPTFNEVDATDITTESLSLLKNNPFVRLDDSDTNNNGEFRLDNTSVRIEADKDNAVAGSKIKFKIDNSEIGFFDENGHLDIDGNLVVASGQGIDFSATSGTGTSELFSDYEQGSWSPVAARFTGGAISATYNTQAGYYTKVGNLVTCSFYIDISSISQGSSLTYISGLPYAPARSYYDVGTTGNNTAFTTVDVVSMLAHTDSRLYFREAGNTSSNSSAAWAAGALSGTITYMTS
jgi:hypothetical protein